MIELFLSAFALGLLFNAAPGAIFAESLRRGIRSGFGPAFEVQLGSLVGDFTWAVLGLTGAAALFSSPWVEKPLALAGAGLLLWVAWQSLRDAMGPVPVFETAPAAPGQHSAFGVGAAMSLSNPFNITYWAGLGGTITALGVADPGWTAFALFLAGFMTSSLLWCFICAGFIGWTRRFVGPVAWVAINVACAAGLAIFGGTVLLRVLTGG
jgi:threonine/homoserine/homoserine lactone efflux protein